LLVRYREADGRLGEAAVIASLPLAGTDLAGVIRFGPDRALYVGLGSRTPEADLARADVEGGRILRLTAEGRTPRDNPRSSPVFSSGHRDPSGFAWHRAGRTFWEVESGADADELNMVRAGGHYGWPSVSGRARLSGATSPRVVLPQGTLPSGLTIVNDDRSPLDADLIVSSIGLQDVLRLEMTPEGQPAAGDPVRLLQGRYGAIGQVTAGPDGALYFVTRNRETWGPGRDAIVRLSPATR
jgi:glucose/arabinose dehydrogenase